MSRPCVCYPDTDDGVHVIHRYRAGEVQACSHRRAWRLEDRQLAAGLVWKELRGPARLVAVHRAGLLRVQGLWSFLWYCALAVTAWVCGVLAAVLLWLDPL